MSRTVKFTLAAALAFTFGVNAAQAQDTQSGAKQSLSEIMQSMSTQKTGSATISNEIENRIRSIMKDMQSSPTGANSKPVTINEIDQLNRAAERERTELEFQKAKTERSQLEIERLLTLYEAVKALEEDKKAEAEAVQKQMMVLAEENNTDNQVDPQAEAFQRDQKNLPRIDSISGVGGVFTAEAQFGHFMKTLREGAGTAHGFTVKEITPSYVALQGPSGTIFQLDPQAPVPPAPPQAPMNGSSNGVIDLSQFPMGQF
jgi:hypothetical protein